MKFKVVLAGALAAVCVAGGVGAAAYYSMAGPNNAVEVVPVSNVNYPDIGYYDNDDMIYGSVTSSVSQEVPLEDDFAIDQIYVTKGEEVKEGTPLFSYDMTLAELELEMKQIELQVQQLNLTKLNKELESYENGTYRDTADLEENDDFEDTMSADEEFIIEDAEPSASSDSDTYVSDSSDSYSAEPEATYTPDYSDELIIENEPVITEEPSAGSSQSAESTQSAHSASGSSGSDSVSAGDIEVSVTDLASEDSDSEHSTVSESENEVKKEVPESIIKYETLIDALRSLIEEYKEDLISEDIEDAIILAVQYYRENLADEVEDYSDVTDDEEVKYYTLKSSLYEDLTASEYTKLETYVRHMEEYHAYYVDLLIREAVNATGEEQETAIEKAWNAYDDLSGDARVYVKNLAVLESLESENGIHTLHGSTENDAESGGNDVTTDSGSDNSENEYGLNTLKTPEPNVDEDYIVEEPDTNENETETEIDLEDLIAFYDSAESLLNDSSAETDVYWELIKLYQQEFCNAAAYWQDYELNSEIKEILENVDSPKEIELETLYKSLCLDYVELLVTNLYADVKATDEELFDIYENLDLAIEIWEQAYMEWGIAQNAYDCLGSIWDDDVEKQYREHLLAGEISEDDLIISIEDPTKENVSLSDILSACELIVGIDGLYYSIIDQYGSFNNADLTDENILSSAEILYADYSLLSSTQKELVWNIELLEEILGLLEDVVEDESEWDTEDYDWDDGDWGDYGDWGDDDYYSDDVEEEIIYLKQQIKECELEIKEMELEIEQDQRVVDGKVVKSTLNGVVIDIGDLDGSSADDYFVKVSSTSGLYAKGVVSELELDSVKVGDLISGVSENDISFIAEIKEIADYPDPEGSDMTYGTGNSNVSYYPFYALIEDSEDIDEGDAELQLDMDLVTTRSGIFLESYFVRKDNSGNNYVYVADQDGLLTKRNVKVGKTYYDYWVEIKAGLSLNDLIAFPYGDNVKEGADTKEVDFLEDNYE